MYVPAPSLLLLLLLLLILLSLFVFTVWSDFTDTCNRNLVDMEVLTSGTRKLCACGVCESVEFHSVQVSGSTSLPAALAVLEAKAASTRESGEGVRFIGQIKLAPGHYDLEEIANWEVNYDVHITGSPAGKDGAELLLPKSVAWTFSAENNVASFIFLCSPLS